MKNKIKPRYSRLSSGSTEKFDPPIVISSDNRPAMNALLEAVKTGAIDPICTFDPIISELYRWHLLVKRIELAPKIHKSKKGKWVFGNKIKKVQSEK